MTEFSPKNYLKEPKLTYYSLFLSKMTIFLKTKKEAKEI